MGSARLLLASLLAVSALASGDIPDAFPPHFSPQQNGLAAFAGVVVDGGGKSVERADTLEGVVRVETVLPTHRTAAEPQPRMGEQKVLFRAQAIHDPKVRTFETPPNGTHVIGFGIPEYPPDGLLLIYADQLYADSPANRALFQPVPAYTPNPWQGRFFFGILIFAGCALVGAWIHLGVGFFLLAASLLAWAGYESTLSAHANIRLDLAGILPAIAIASTSVLLAWKEAVRKSREAAAGRVNPPNG